VRLHFAEVYHESVGERVFSVEINGEAVLEDFDIVAAAGAPWRAIIEEVEVAASDSGKITVAMLRGKAERPKISAIEVVPLE